MLANSMNKTKQEFIPTQLRASIGSEVSRVFMNLLVAILITDKSGIHIPVDDCPLRICSCLVAGETLGDYGCFIIYRI
jgi:hypothetical protein